MIQIAVVGTGIIGRRHTEAVAASEECELCAVCDIREEAAAELAAAYGVPYMTDYREIVTKTDAEAVILNLPHWLHAPAAVYFLEQGLHVLVEKPMANTVAECDRMIAAAEKSGRKLAVGHLQRFFAANRRVRALCRSGELGELCMFREYRSINYFSEDRPKWFLDPALSGGGIVMNYGAHALDKLFYVTGHRSAAVSAVLGNRKNALGIEGHAQFLLRLPDGVGAAVTFNGYGNHGYETVYEFTVGAAKVTGGSRLWLHTAGEWQEQPLPEGDAIALQLREFCRLLRGEASEIVTAEEGRDIVAVIEEIYR